MASAQAIALAVEVKIRLGGTASRRLIELSNETGTPTTINDTVLNACCDDALGEFRIESGVEPDLAYTTHLVALVAGSLYYLEYYKGRNVQQTVIERKKFLSNCKAINERRYVLAQSNSPLQQSTQATGTRPDMDRSKNVWNAGRRSLTPMETYEENV